MPVEYRTGDLFTSEADALAHGCNCQGVMGAGIAVQFKNRYPEMFKEYQRRCQAGQFILGSIYTYEAPDGRIIHNLATQVYPGSHANLNIIEDLLFRIANGDYYPKVKSIAIPRIGCGLGGLSWKDVQRSIQDISGYCRAKLIVYSL